MFSFFCCCPKKADPDKEAIDIIFKQIIQVLKALAPVKFPIVHTVDADAIANNGEDYFWCSDDISFKELLMPSRYLMSSERRPFEDVLYTYNLLISSVQL
jgi:hypothetical protein